MTSSTARPRLGPVLLVAFLDLLGFGLVVPLLSFYAEGYGATPLQVSLLLAVYSACQFVGAPLWGRLSDRVGRRPVLLGTVTASTLSLVGFAASDTVAMLFVFRALQGLAGANIGTAQAYIADVTTGEERARGMGLMGAAFGVGFTLGPFVGGQLAQFGVSAPIWAAAALNAVNLVWVAVGLPESRRKSGTAVPRRALDPRTWLDGLRHPVVGAAVALVFAASFAFSMMEGTFALVAEHVWAKDAAAVGNLFGLVGLVNIIIQGGLIGRLTERFGEGRLVSTGYVLNATGLLILGLAPGGAVVWAGTAVLASGAALANPSLMSLISRGTDEEEQGTVLGVTQSMGALARTFGPAAGGAVYAMWYPSGTLLVAGALMLAALAFSLPATRRARRGPGAPGSGASSPG